MSIEQHKLDHKTPVPLYYQLKNIIMQEISNGSYPVGSNIPTEAVISETFNISRSTVRQAISELAQEGWLERQSSKGTFVTMPQKNVAHIKSFEPFYQQVAKTGKKPKTELLELSIIEADDGIAAELNIELGSKVISMFRRRSADNTPMVTMRNYLPHSLCSFILSHDYRQESLYEVLSQRPESKTAVTKTIISATKATPQDAELLGIKIGSPVLSFNTITRTESGVIVDYAFARYRGDLNMFEIDVRPEK